jgi:hypothetical protein
MKTYPTLIAIVVVLLAVACGALVLTFTQGPALAQTLAGGVV